MQLVHAAEMNAQDVQQVLPTVYSDRAVAPNNMPPDRLCFSEVRLKRVPISSGIVAVQSPRAHKHSKRSMANMSAGSTAQAAAAIHEKQLLLTNIDCRCSLAKNA